MAGAAMVWATPASGAPFTVSSPNTASTPKIKVSGEFKDRETKDTLTLPKVELKTPVASNLDVAIKLPYKTIWQTGHRTESGLGDIEIKSKWNFLRAGNFAMATEPLVALPTGNARRGLGDDDVALELPLILGYKTGAWELGSELGYTHIFHQHHDGAYWGVLAMRRVLPMLRLGVEFVVEAPTALLREYDALANAGLKWGFGERYELQALAGRTLRTADHDATSKFKLAVEMKF